MLWWGFSRLRIINLCLVVLVFCAVALCAIDVFNSSLWSSEFATLMSSILLCSTFIHPSAYLFCLANFLSLCACECALLGLLPCTVLVYSARCTCRLATFKRLFILVAWFCNDVVAVSDVFRVCACFKLMPRWTFMPDLLCELSRGHVWDSVFLRAVAVVCALCCWIAADCRVHSWAYVVYARLIVLPFSYCMRFRSVHPPIGG